MTNKELLSHVDHTLLTQTATWGEIKKVIDDSIKYEVASSCIPASFVKEAYEYANHRVKICTVIGFPNGYDTKESKIFMAEDAISNGASEIDMVINLTWLKDGKFTNIEDEIKSIKEKISEKCLKVIIETCLLTEEEKIRMCEIVTRAGADYIKTSTGFSKAGATFEDIVLFKKYVGDNVKIKAAGGISTLSDAYKFLELGADRLGTSRIIKLIEGEEANGY